MLAAFQATRPSGYENPLPKAALKSALGEKALAGSTQGDSQTPVFSLGKVQYSPPSVIKSLSVQNNILLLLAETGIVLIDLTNPSQEETLPPPWMPGSKPPEPDQVQIFADPQSQHVVLSVHASAENFYLPLKPPAGQAKQLKPLSKLRGNNITAVSFSAQPTALRDPVSTQDILLGTDEGKIIHTCLDAQESRALPFKSTERFSHTLALPFPEDEPITGLRHFLWEKRVALVVATTTHLYQFVARVNSNKEDPFDALQKTYADGKMLPKTLDLPGDERLAGTLHFSGETSSTLGRPKAVAWCAGPGVYHGSVTFSSQEPGDGLIDHAQLYPHPPLSESDPDDRSVPLDMALTPYHMILLGQDETVRVVRILDDRPVFKEALDLTASERGQKPMRLVADTLQGTYWVFTTSAIYELALAQEDRDIWQVYLQKHMLDQALAFTKNPRQKDVVLRAQADTLMRQGKTVQAADIYAQTAKSFEEVVLMLSENEDALRTYLASKLSSLQKTDLSARMALATWLLATYLSKLNTLDDALFSESDQELRGNLEVESQIVNEDVRVFLKNYKANLDTRTTLDLMRTHGRTDVLLDYARLIEDHSIVLDHFIDEEDWSNALTTLASTRDLELYYRSAHELLCHVPEETVQQLMRRPELDPARLLPSLLLPSHPNASQHIKRYLSWLVKQGTSTVDSSIHNTLLALHVSDGTELSFLEETETEEPAYDLEHALRLCLAAKRTQACAVIYGKMSMYESAVDVALDVGDLDLAKTHADRAADHEDEFLRKKLWKKIAGKLVKDKHDIQEAMRFLETDALKIEDILPFFPDFVLIDSFKDDICEALESYAERIQDLKSEMKAATNNADVIKRDITELSHRLVVVDSADKCCVCQSLLLKRQFYVFPCGHSFHADCLVSEVTANLSATQLKRVLYLQERLRQYQTSVSSQVQLATQQQQPSSEATEAVSLANLGTGSGLLKALPFSRSKLTTASLQSVDQLRKLVLPDALVGVIGAGFEGMKVWADQADPRKVGSAASVQSEELEKVRAALDDILASSCVWCDRGVSTIDQGFLQDGEVDE